ncbi:ABC transporter ATP-binding protein [Enterococcus casseliflavus]|uniref:ABC transporter ATP-binding protein n=1 Tax=Enterococcus casseliflavus TaxID=37734 RepID=UPI0018842CF4|nr:ABC transporter ATP-binding protein [Enterococcus casseliflavus]MBE9908885.1 ABC transporter ATP-binding protein [Enterococcus casseliflavus]
MENQTVLKKYLIRKKNLLISSAFFATISTLMQFVPFYCIYKIIELLMLGDYTAQSLMYWGMLSILSLIVSLIFLYASSMCSHIAAFNILYEIRMDLLGHLTKVPMGYFTQHSSGQMIKTIDQAVEKMESFIAHQIPDIVSAIIFPVIYVGLMIGIDWRLGLVSLFPIIVGGGLYIMLMGKTLKDNTVKQYHDSLEEMNSNGVEYVRAMPAVKVFNLSVNNFKRFHQSIQDYRTLVVAWTKNFRGGYIWFTTLITSVVLFVLPFGAYLISQEPQNTNLSLTVMLFVILSSGTNAPFMKLMFAASTFSNVSEGVQRVDQMFAVKEVEEKNTDRMFGNNGISYENVYFSYTKDTPTLKDINFELKPNTMNALVGPSGGGKSTIAQLLLRFYDVDQGSIKIGNLDIREVSIDTLMNQVSFVFQDVTLFNDTIEANIRMGNKDISFDEVKRIAELARCHEFIKVLPNGYNTKIGEKGIFLSKGEAQRISIARALLKNSPILVLDEATAYADAENEVYIQQAINELVVGKTVLIIAHRLWTIQHVDQILVCNEGVIEQVGTHEELLKKNDLYAKLWKINTETKEWGASSYV